MKRTPDIRAHDFGSRHALHLLGEPDQTISSIAKLLGVSRSTLYKAMPELVPSQRGPAALDAPLES